MFLQDLMREVPRLLVSPTFVRVYETTDVLNVEEHVFE
jgi:hypothetical protein